MTPEDLMRIHEMCDYVRVCYGKGRCRECPETEDTPYGPATSGCVLLTRGLLKIATTPIAAPEVSYAAIRDVRGEHG